jgi:hypothetical protein
MVALFPLGQVVVTPEAIAAGESEAAGYLLLGTVTQSGTGANWSQPMSQRMSTAWLMVSIAEQLPDRRRGDAVDNHRSGPVCNHAAVARRVLNSCEMKRDGFL